MRRVPTNGKRMNGTVKPDTVGRTSEYSTRTLSSGQTLEDD